MEGRDPLTEQIIGAAIEVHRHLGPGLLESLYLRALCHELLLRDISFRTKQPVPIEYKGCLLGDDLQLDLVIDNRLIVELKSEERLHPVHESQLITYLKLTGIHTGLLINFNVRLVRDGIKRLVL